jgi:hypothetical protein
MQNSNDQIFKTLPARLPAAVLGFVFWSFNIVSDLGNSDLGFKQKVKHSRHSHRNITTPIGYGFAQ